MVLDECHRQISEATGKQQGKIDELNAEIRKLKAMIGKLVVMIELKVDLALNMYLNPMDHLFLFNIFWFFYADSIFILVKHETRIRTLETKNKEQEKQLLSQGIHLNNNGHSGEDLDPDEVWGIVADSKPWLPKNNEI